MWTTTGSNSRSSLSRKLSLQGNTDYYYDGLLGGEMIGDNFIELFQATHFSIIKGPLHRSGASGCHPGQDSRVGFREKSWSGSNSNGFS
jgi:hypothetical protein